jgi:hypothetical protein
MTSTYYLAHHDGTGWWHLLEVLTVKATEEGPIPLEVARAHWPQVKGDPANWKILMAIKDSSDEN